MLLAQTPSWLKDADQWVYILLILVLPALGKFAQWIRDLQQNKATKDREEVELTGELLEHQPVPQAQPSRKNASLPQPFESVSSKSARMERVPPPPPALNPRPAQAWQPRTGSMETPRPIPAKPQPEARRASTRPLEAPRGSKPTQPQQASRRIDAAGRPREDKRQKQAVRDVVEMIARKPAPRSAEDKMDRSPSDSGSTRKKATPPPAVAIRPQEDDSSSTPLGRLDHSALRRAFILREILDPPVGLR